MESQYLKYKNRYLQLKKDLDQSNSMEYVGGYKALYNKEKENVLVLESNDGSKKLYIVKTYIIDKMKFNQPRYSVYTDEGLTTIYDNIKNWELDGLNTQIPFFSSYFNKEQITCVGDNLLFAEIANSPFAKLNMTFCKKEVEKTEKSLSDKFKKHFISDKVKQMFNLKMQKPLQLDKDLALRCNIAIKKATEEMINQARIANTGTLLSVGTLGTTAVASLMAVSGVAASTGVGLPIAAGLMALSLVANQLYRLYNKNQELKNVMFLIWVMCYRFENLIRLMLKMSDKYDFNINVTLMPLKGVMERLIGLVVALAPRSTFIQIKDHYTKIDDIASYKITDNAAFKERDASHESDKSSVMGKFKNSVSRSLARITSPDENYRVLIRDISILGLWFSIIFSEFMLVTGVRNNRVKELVKNANPTIKEGSIDYIQAQLDFMNSITDTKEYQNLVKNAAITEKNTKPATKSVDLQINQQAVEILNELEKITEERDNLQTKATEQLIESDEINQIIHDTVNTVETNYKQLSQDSKNKLIQEIESNLSLKDLECPDNDEECSAQKMPVIFNLHLFSVLFKRLGFQNKGEEYAKLVDEKLTGI